jgi:ATP-dependent DNA helicase RecG
LSRPKGLYTVSGFWENRARRLAHQGMNPLCFIHIKKIFLAKLDKILYPKMKDGCLTLSGALLFSDNVEHKLPVYRVKAVVFIGNDISGGEYLDSKEITGKLEDIYKSTLTFILNTLHRVQGNQGFNSTGILEISRAVFEELIVNALLHRDYFISAPVRVLVFDNRIEIISPGTLPNNLTVENIKYSNSNIRNPVLASYATHILPYKGIGSGIKRTLKEYPHITFTNDKEGNLFAVTIKRPEWKGR